MSKYAVIDVETTGFGKADRVVEIGVVVIDANSGEVVMARIDSAPLR